MVPIFVVFNHCHSLALFLNYVFFFYRVNDKFIIAFINLNIEGLVLLYHLGQILVIEKYNYYLFHS